MHELTILRKLGGNPVKGRSFWQEMYQLLSMYFWVAPFFSFLIKKKSVIVCLDQICMGFFFFFFIFGGGLSVSQRFYGGHSCFLGEARLGPAGARPHGGVRKQPHEQRVHGSSLGLLSIGHVCHPQDTGDVSHTPRTAPGTSRPLSHFTPSEMLSCFR